MQHGTLRALIGPALVAALSAGAIAQSTERACFVANNGNIDGSISSFTFDETGQAVLVDRLVTGVDDEPGTNPQTISITPSGKYLATGHGTISDTTEQLTIIEVAPDATLSTAAVFFVPDSPLAVAWYSDDLLAVTHTDVGGANELLLYRWDPAGPSLTLLDSVGTGQFTHELALHPTLPIIYTQDSWSAYKIQVVRVNPDDTLDLIQSLSTGSIYPLGMAVSHDGSKLYSTGGISSGRHAVHGYNIAPDGTLTVMTNSPYNSPGDSPKDAVFSEDDGYVFVSHGSDATLRTFAVDPITGDITPTGYSFDVGIQGSLGDAKVLGDLMLVTDEYYGDRGLYAFTINPDGSLTSNGPIVDTLGVTPESIAVWPGVACAPDFNGDTGLNSQDFIAFLNAFVVNDPSADYNNDGTVNSQDFIAFLNDFVAGC
jgi:6-phosphogluconolactonase (cycloisomerase 2 family)